MSPPRPAVPRYRQVADELRRRMVAGAIPPGALLPAEPALIAEFGVSRGTVREALAHLRAAGLVITEHGRGTYARPVLPVRRLAADRYRTGAANPPQTAFTADRGVSWDAYQLEKSFVETAAPDEVAGLFAVPAGTMVLARHFVFRAHGVPQQMSTSYLLLDLVAGTPVADPANEPWPGGSIAQLTTLGVTVTGVSERVRARVAAPDETATLRVPTGVPVVTITRRMFAGDTVVEVAHDIVLPADRVELDYWIDLT